MGSNALPCDGHARWIILLDTLHHSADLQYKVRCFAGPGASIQTFPRMRPSREDQALPPFVDEAVLPSSDNSAEHPSCYSPQCRFVCGRAFNQLHKQSFLNRIGKIGRSVSVPRPWIAPNSPPWERKYPDTNGCEYQSFLLVGIPSFEVPQQRKTLPRGNLDRVTQIGRWTGKAGTLVVHRGSALLRVIGRSVLRASLDRLHAGFSFSSGLEHAVVNHGRCGGGRPFVDDGLRGRMTLNMNSPGRVWDFNQLAMLLDDNLVAQRETMGDPHPPWRGVFFRRPSPSGTAVRASRPRRGLPR